MWDIIYLLKQYIHFTAFVSFQQNLDVMDIWVLPHSF